MFSVNMNLNSRKGLESYRVSINGSKGRQSKIMKKDRSPRNVDI